MCPVIDGQAVSAAVTNPAFIDAQVDDVALGKIGFHNTDVDSGPFIENIQKCVNRLFTATGVDETSSDGTSYNASPGTIANGDTYENALRILANKFNNITGHTHDGSPGDGGPIVIGSGVSSITPSGGTSVFGDIVFVPSGGMTITTSGQEIIFTAGTGGGGGGVSGVVAGAWYNGQPTSPLIQNVATVAKYPTKQVDVGGTGNDYNTSTGIYTVAAGNAGYYSVTAAAEINATNMDYTLISIFKNGSRIQTGFWQFGSASNVDAAATIALHMIPLAAGDTIAIFVATDGSSPTWGVGVTGVNQFSITKIGSSGAGGGFTIYGSTGTPVTVSAAGGVTSTGDQRALIFTNSAGGAVTVTASPQISAGTIVGQELRLVGTSDTNYISLADGTGLSLNGQILLKQNITIDLWWNGSLWVESSRE